jgi:serine/threonine protein phosphatase PrpC
VPDGLVLGLRLDGGRMFESLLEEAALNLEPDDLLVFYTDGISEAMNPSEECFGDVRLAELIASHGHLTSDELRTRILQEVDRFAAGAPQHDDMTMILVKVEGRGCGAGGPGTEDPGAGMWEREGR